MKPNKLLVRNTKKQAGHLIHHLGLDKEDWMGVGIGETLVGRGFDKIVIDVHTKGMPQRQYEKFRQWRDKTLKTRLNNPKEQNIIDI